MIRFVLLLAFLCCTPLALAQAVVLEGPGQIEKNDLEIILITGMTQDEVNRATVVVSPADGVTCLPGSFGQQPVLLFRARHAGTYKVDVGQNIQHLAWRSQLDQAVASATSLGVDDAVLAKVIADLKTVAMEADKAFPTRGGSCVVEVAGAPFPPGPGPGPDPPEPPTPGKRHVLIIHETGDDSREHASLYQDLQVPNRRPKAYEYLKSKGHTVQVLDDELAAKLGLLAKIGSTLLPAVVVIDPVSSAAVSAAEPLPATALEVVELVKRNGG